ncbi:MAG TPA: hypothetical protein VFE03_08705 [Caulobacteraceae bacterium]|nr:hypothetical protein [Caulobacteraceae bacterium]
MTLFQRATSGGSSVERGGLLKVYKEGRQDERARTANDAERHAKDPTLRDAYERGRRDQKARRRSSPVIALVLLLAAAAGGGALFLAAREGSFAAGGTVVDRQVAKAADATSRISGRAAEQTGDALAGAGRQLKPASEPNHK